MPQREFKISEEDKKLIKDYVNFCFVLRKVYTPKFTKFKNLYDVMMGGATKITFEKSINYIYRNLKVKNDSSLLDTAAKLKEKILESDIKDICFSFKNILKGTEFEEEVRDFLILCTLKS